MQMARGVVYSLHKSSTREVNDCVGATVSFIVSQVWHFICMISFPSSVMQHVKKAALRDFGADGAEVLYQVRRLFG